MNKAALATAAFALAAATTTAAAGAEKPRIQKLGTIECDLVEATPIVFQGRLYRFDYVRTRYKPNQTGDSYFRFVDVATGEATPAFAAGHNLGSAFVEGDTVYVYGVKGWGTENIYVFWSKDLKTWSSQVALARPGWTIFNTSVCKEQGRYLMAFEVGGPLEVVGRGFTNRFAESADLLNWKLLDEPRVFSKERYTACPSIRYLDGYLYAIYLEARPGPTYETHVVRSKDLIQWETSPRNPVLRHSPEDKRIVNPKLGPEQRKRIAEAVNLNNSDVDLCEFQGKVVIYYSWGNQQGIEHLAEAVYEGTLESFLRGFFPEQSGGEFLPGPWKNPLVKKGKLGSPLVEVTPFVFKDRFVMLENWRHDWPRPEMLRRAGTDQPQIAVRDVEKDEYLSVALTGYSLGVAFVREDRVYVFGAHDAKGRTEIGMTWSADLKQWSAPAAVLKAVNETFFNVSVCRGPDRFVMLVETDDRAWPAFTFKYFESQDLVQWKQVPGALYGTKKYVGGPALYYEGEMYYTLYLESLGGGRYETRVARSKDLVHWEDAPDDRPFVTFDPENPVHPLRSKTVRESNASDAELIHWKGKTLVYFTGGDQHAAGDLQWAEFGGTPRELLESFFK